MFPPLVGCRGMIHPRWVEKKQLTTPGMGPPPTADQLGKLLWEEWGWLTLTLSGLAGFPVQIAARGGEWSPPPKGGDSRGGKHQGRGGNGA